MKRPLSCGLNRQFLVGCTGVSTVKRKAVYFVPAERKDYSLKLGGTTDYVRPKLILVNLGFFALINANNYEEWRLQNPEKSYIDFLFSLEKMNNSGALFDLNKLNDISKEVLSRMPAEQIYNSLLEWAK